MVAKPGRWIRYSYIVAVVRAGLMLVLTKPVRGRGDFIFTNPTEESIMSLLKWALAFLVIAGIAALFGFTGIAEGAADIAKVLFAVFLVIFAILGLLAMTVYKSVT